MDRKTLIVAVVIFLAAAFVGFQFIYLPKTQRLQSLEEALKEEERLNRLSEEIASMEKRLNSYRSRLLEKDREETELIDRVREIAQKVQVKVISMTPASPRKRERRQANFVLLKVTFQGSYHQLGDFIANVENSEKFLRIESVRFSIPLPGSPESTITHEVEIDTPTYL